MAGVQSQLLESRHQFPFLSNTFDCHRHETADAGWIPTPASRELPSVMTVR